MAGVFMMLTEEAREREENAAITAFEQVDEDRWWWLLGVLPPLNHRRVECTESFALGGAHTGRVHVHAVRFKCDNEAYHFEARKRIGTPHDELVAECRALLTGARG